jgi:hypothetical protein
MGRLLCCVYCRPQGGDAYPRVDGSIVGTVAATLTLPTAAVIILSGEVVIEIAIPCHRAAALTSIVQILCHGEVGGFHQSFVVHVLIIGIGESGSPPLVDSCSGEHVTRVEVFDVKDLGLSCLSHELANIPGEVLLEDTLASNAERITQSI